MPDKEPDVSARSQAEWKEARDRGVTCMILGVLWAGLTGFCNIQIYLDENNHLKSVFLFIGVFVFLPGIILLIWGLLLVIRKRPSTNQKGPD
ncbi:MAG: hypothetical protein CME88_14465 [Hirschia sp.]|nr:hypothetical protein [Hirschia sp.]MBF19577.1 hypothetical protein [Hirschia sp.]|tara:strand:- start:407 stop:682 length:276 start_codon:yes stop_codon:yes gene_type:complete